MYQGGTWEHNGLRWIEHLHWIALFLESFLVWIQRGVASQYLGYMDKTLLWLLIGLLKFCSQHQKGADSSGISSR
jgi:hypothetical protein